MKIAVIVCTYWRKSGDSKQNLLNVFKMLESQTYQDFKLFLIGDHYEKTNEFSELCNDYKKDIFYYNNDDHFREGYFKMNYNKWSSGGILAINIGIKQAIEENYDYYFHLDDDDLWELNHIESVVNVIKDYPEVDITINKSKCLKQFLPNKGVISQNIEYNNCFLKPCDSVHSSICINLKTLGEKFVNEYTNRINIINQIKNNKIKEKKLYPIDAQILKTLQQLQNNETIKCIYIPILTVYKDKDCNVPV